MIALLGMLRATVIPQPAYNPRIPCARYKAINVPANVAFRGIDEESNPRTVVIDLGRSSSSVCIVLFTVSAGNRARLNAAPAHAPENADSQGRSCMSVELRRRAKSSDATYSLVPNQAAVPPVSRIKVPVWPNHSPRRPVLRITDTSNVIGPGSFSRDIPTGGTTNIWTCILHLTSSIGVLQAYKVRKWEKDITSNINWHTGESWWWHPLQHLQEPNGIKEVSLEVIDGIYDGWDSEFHCMTRTKTHSRP